MQTIDRFRAAVERRDLATAAQLFAPDVRFVSPVRFTPMRGLPTVKGLFAVLLRTFEDFRYVGVLRGEAEIGHDGDLAEAYILIFRAAIADTQVHGIDLLQLDAEGRIREFTVMIRPLSALTALSEAVYAGLVSDGVVLAVDDEL